MTEVYPPAYDYLWNDGGAWYLDFVYGRANVLKELATANSPYFFILFEQEKVGVLRIQHGEVFPTLADKAASKLHRLYLHPKVQGKSVGMHLMNWTIEETRKLGYEILWLEAMDTKTDALGFYKKCGFEIANLVTVPYERLHLALRGMHQLWRTV
jgi:GNAT superfamily N-acetyltransferase